MYPRMLSAGLQRSPRKLHAAQPTAYTLHAIRADQAKNVLSDDMLSLFCDLELSDQPALILYEAPADAPCANIRGDYLRCSFTASLN